MQKILMISLMIQLCAATTLGRLAELELENTKMENANLELVRGVRAYRAFRPSANRSYICATIIAHKCIPPCRKYHGKVGRNCNPREKQQHLMFYLLKK